MGRDCCSVDTSGEAVIDKVRQPIALIWKNVSPNALRKRTWAPVNLFSKASLQVPQGEFGIIYVSYNEGTRAEAADMRVEAFNERIRNSSTRPRSAFLSQSCHVYIPVR